MSISDKANFRENRMFRDKEGHYIMLKESILKEDITIFNCMYLMTLSKYIR